MKIDWKRKLASRKFWLAVVGFVTGVIVMICGDSDLANSVGGVIMSGASVVSYIVAEGLTDAAAIENKKEDEDK